MKRMNQRFFIFASIAVIVAIVGGGFAYAAYRKHAVAVPIVSDASVSATTTVPVEPPKPLVTHLVTPKPVKALYMSSWVAASPKYYQHVVDLVDSTEANAVVIDIKDATGKVSFLIDDPEISDTKSPENRIHSISEFINMLHSKNIYVIGRISTFQDPYLAKVRPEWALTKKSDGSIWKDPKGLAFLDPENSDVLDYLVALGTDSYNLGFDEINYDYIRYPSDGNIRDINYQIPPGKTKADNIVAFAEKLHARLKKTPGLTMSADLFGETTTATDDMGIGQVLERMLPNFDYIAPMVYPSHYDDFIGYKKPAEHPYEVVLAALKGAKVKIDAMKANPNTDQATKDTVSFDQIRPWLQDFSIRGTTYDAVKIKAEIKGTYDAGLDSWMMWDPSNKYTIGAYEK